MNKDTILGIVRHVLTTSAGVLVGKGVLESGQVEVLVGALIGIVGVVWSIIAKKKAKPTA